MKAIICRLVLAGLSLSATACGYIRFDHISTEVAGACLDGQHNGDESDTDCGGACGACALGARCVGNDDCDSGLCGGKRCVAELPVACTNGVQDADESDVDCGGGCLGCALGAGCAVDDACESGICSAGVCVASLPASCNDGIQNADESDIDCGGSCSVCADGQRCSGTADCSSAVCNAGICQAATCSDGTQNGSETGIDCGGSCAACTVTIAAIKVTRQHTCVRRSDGTMRCWGRNVNAQISGDGSTASPQRDPIAPQTGFTGPIRAMAAANAHSCGVSSSGQAHCWGGLGGSGEGSSAATVISGATDLSDVMGSKNYSCGITSSGAVRCWGLGYFGGATASAVTIAGVSDVRALGLGDDHACALQGDGTVRCWGDNTYGQLGDGTHNNSSTPVTVSGISDAIAIASSRQHNCVIRTDGTVRCWGRNDRGQLGDGSTTASNVPVTATGLSDVTHISSGDAHVCARTSSSHLYCWGRNQSYESGIVNPYPNATTPQQVRVNLSGAVLSGVALPSMGENFSCVVMDDLVTVQCWGANNYGQCGPGVGGGTVTTYNSFTVP
ncbi:MAG: RCC1 domain-containing protein [Polyangiales bacterium]